MALECAHCGARVDDGAKRCPQCLRATGLIEAPPERSAPAAARARRPASRIAVGLAVALLAGGGAVAVALHARSRPASGATFVAHGVASELPPALDAGPALAPLVARVRAQTDALARARTALDELAHARGASGARVVDDPDDTPPARAPDAIDHALRTSGGRATPLDLARLLAAVLRAAGTEATVAERTAPPRDGEPVEPTGLLGSYVVLVAGHAADPVAGELTAAQDSRPHPLDDAALAGAMLAQSALASAVSGAAHDRTIALADGAVDTWRDGATPLAVRAFVARVLGTAGESASQDLASAIALRDDAAFHLLRARLALATGDLPTAAAESTAAQSRARAWGDAALAAASVPRAPGGDAGEPCAPLAAAHEPWTDDALVLCRRAPAELVPAAAERLAGGTHDPLRLAWAAAAGAPSAQGRVRARDRGEFAAWLALLGRPDLAGAAASGGDAGP